MLPNKKKWKQVLPHLLRLKALKQYFILPLFERTRTTSVLWEPSTAINYSQTTWAALYYSLILLFSSVHCRYRRHQPRGLGKTWHDYAAIHIPINIGTMPRSLLRIGSIVQAEKRIRRLLPKGLHLIRLWGLFLALSRIGESVDCSENLGQVSLVGKQYSPFIRLRRGNGWGKIDLLH